MECASEIENTSEAAPQPSSQEQSRRDSHDSRTRVSPAARDIMTNTICRRCLGSDDAETMLLCESCDYGYHIDC